MLANSEDLQNSFAENNPTAVGLFGFAKRSKTTEVRLEISESGHGLMLSFLKVAPQPEFTHQRNDFAIHDFVKGIYFITP